MGKLITVAALALLLINVPAEADPGCDHPNFYVVGCTYPGLNGTDGIDGVDGIDGKDGRDGLDGKDGKDGVVPREWYNKMTRYRDYTAAAGAIDFMAPVRESTRVAVGVSSMGSRNAIGFSMSHRFGKNETSILSLGVGSAGLEEVYKGQLSVEF